MNENRKDIKSLGLLIFLGVSFALSACATLPPSARQQGLEDRVALLEKKLQEISAQVEKNRAGVQDQEARINEQRALLDHQIAEKVTSEPPKPVFDPSPGLRTGSATPAAIYREAFGNYASGRFQQAVRGFQAFLERYPDNSYAPNARFWLGESHYALEEFPQALKEFDFLAGMQPPSEKVPESLARMATILNRMQDHARARETAEFLLKTYPESAAAQTLRQSMPELRTP